MHNGSGWVRGGVVPTLIQVFGRNHLLIAALAPIEEVRTLALLPPS